MYKTGVVNILHHCSALYKHVSRSTTESELQALILGCYYGLVIRDVIAEILGRDVSMEASNDRTTVCDKISKYGKTTKRLLHVKIRDFW